MDDLLKFVDIIFWPVTIYCIVIEIMRPFKLIAEKIIRDTLMS